MWKQIRWPLFVLVVAVVVIFSYQYYMRSLGYRWQWSGANMRFIWVDQDGKLP